MATSKENQGYVIHDNDYCSAYDVYRRGLLEQQKSWLSNQVIPELSSRLDKSCLRVLAIGSGEGDVDVVLLSELQAAFKSKGKDCDIEYVVIERNKSFIERFQKRVKESPIGGVKFLWLNDTYENVVSQKADSFGTFDFINLFHSVYYMSAEDVCKQLMDRYLNAGGCMLIVVQSENNLYTKNCRKFDGKLEDCFNGFNVISDKDMKFFAEKNGWEHKIDAGKRVLDLTLILSDKLNTKDGSELFDFFFHSKDLIKHLKEEQLKEILDFFKSNSKVVDGKFLSDGTEAIVYLFKN